MGSANSSTETRERARALADQIGRFVARRTPLVRGRPRLTRTALPCPRGCASYHVNLDIDQVTSALVAIFTTATGRVPRFRVFGGSDAENLALQNVQVGISPKHAATAVASRIT